MELPTKLQMANGETLVRYRWMKNDVQNGHTTSDTLRRIVRFRFGLRHAA